MKIRMIRTKKKVCKYCYFSVVFECIIGMVHIYCFTYRMKIDH